MLLPNGIDSYSERRKAPLALRRTELHFRYKFDIHRLAEAIAATFARRSTPIPTETPDGLKPEFYNDRAKTAQWRAFVADVAVDPSALADVAAVLADFLMQAAAAVAEAGRAVAEPEGARATDGGAADRRPAQC